jgi:hypothetical protein
MKTIPTDKILHLSAGFTIAIVLSFVVGPMIGVAAGAAAGVAKEVYDKYIKKTTFDFFDMFATIIGSVLGMFTCQFIVLYMM